MNKNFSSHMIWGCASLLLLILTVSCSESLSPNNNETAIQKINSESLSRAIITPPPANILAPANNQVINVGDNLFFAAGSSDTGVPLTYIWNFDGATADSFFRAPGSIDFLKAGTFNVSLTTYDSLGTMSQDVAIVTVTVLADSNINQAPTGKMLTPFVDEIIATGDSLDFTAMATDPENMTAMTYDWNFDGAVMNSTVLNPGLVTFDKTGVYKITFTTTDAMGQVDTNPSSHFVTVKDITIANSDFPESTITVPAMDMTIAMGDTVAFEGTGLSPTPNDPLTFLWTFDGVAPDSMMDIPDPVIFDMAGVYTIMFTVTDSLAQADPTPAQVIITVTDPAAPPPAEPVAGDEPMAEMTAPMADVTIVAGESVEFMSMASSPVGNEPLTYLWAFDGGAPDSMEQNPGMVLFESTGEYEIELIVTDSMGVENAKPPLIIVTVDEPAPVDTPPVDPAVPAGDEPTAEITMPTMDMTIIVGDTVDFASTAMSPVANDPITYLWDFAGGAPELMDQNPGLVTFNMEGIYEVTLTVTDSMGLVNIMPLAVIITVDPVGTAPVDPTVPPVDPVPADAPMGEIDSPDPDMVITAGDIISFAGEGDSPTDSPLTYLWTFGGAAPDSDMAEPGDILFDMEGEYTVTFTVTDEAGMSDPMPPTVMVTVEPAAAPPP